jgi:hypothetical protein
VDHPSGLYLVRDSVPKSARAPAYSQAQHRQALAPPKQRLTPPRDRRRWCDASSRSAQCWFAWVMLRQHERREGAGPFDARHVRRLGGSFATAVAASASGAYRLARRSPGTCWARQLPSAATWRTACRTRRYRLGVAAVGTLDLHTDDYWYVVIQASPTTRHVGHSSRPIPGSCEGSQRAKRGSQDSLGQTCLCSTGARVWFRSPSPA